MKDMILNEYSGKEILEKLNTGEISVLKELGAYELKQEMAAVGFFGKMLADFICLSKNDGKLRQRAVNIIKPFAPYKLSGDFPQYDGAIIIGFNHPSLGEIFRLLCVGFTTYSQRQFLFPVNIPWYECLVPIIPKLTRMGVSIVPMITPSTDKKLNRKFEGDEDKLALVRRIKAVFERNYMRAAREFADKGGITVVAPSATRQAEVISDHIHPTMTFLAHMVLKKEDAKAMFLPVMILEPEKNDRKLNILKYYGIRPCEPFFAEEVRELSDGTRDFDYAFLKRIDKVYGKTKHIRTTLSDNQPLK